MTAIAMKVEAPAAASPRCALHSERVSRGTCDRCGRFICEGCYGESGTCPACIEARLSELPKSSGRARLTTLTFWVMGASTLLNLLVSGAFAGEKVLAALVALGLLDVVSGLASLVAIVSFLMWQHLVVRRADIATLPGPISPAWSVGAWFVPFANLVVPYQLFAGLRSRLQSNAPVGWWWATYLGSGVLACLHILVLVDRSSFFDANWPDWPERAVNLASLVPLVLCITVIRRTQAALVEAERVAISPRGLLPV